MGKKEKLHGKTKPVIIDKPQFPVEIPRLEMAKRIVEAVKNLHESSITEGRFYDR